MDNDQANAQFWNSLLQPTADSNLKDDLYPEIRSPIIIDEPGEPSKVLEDGDKEDDALKKGKEKEEGDTEDTKTLNKRPRDKEDHRINDKRIRTEIRSKVDELKELTRCHSKNDLLSTLDAIVDRVREMTSQVEAFYGKGYTNLWKSCSDG